MESPFAEEPDWQYDFEKMPDGPLPTEDWNFTVGTEASDYNSEAQAYTDIERNVRIEDGALVIEALGEPYGNRGYTSGRVDTKGKFEFTYGKLEVAMKLPTGAGTWPAAWMMPSTLWYKPENYGADPATRGWPFNGEIDIMEAIGTEPETVFASVHTFNRNHAVSDPITEPHTTVPAPHEDFHVYGVEWLPDSIVFTVDGNAFHSYEKPSDDPRDWPFNQPYYLILNLAMGGTFGGQREDLYPPYGIDDSSMPWKLLVKSVRHFPLEDAA